MFHKEKVFEEGNNRVIFFFFNELYKSNRPKKDDEINTCKSTGRVFAVPHPVLEEHFPGITFMG